MRNVVILGSGCAGNTAAIYAARANLKPWLSKATNPAASSPSPRKWKISPAFPKAFKGPQLVENMKKQAERFGAEYLHGRVIEADLSQAPVHVSSSTGEAIETRTLIIASGASARWLNLPNEQKLIGHGVSSCATCDGFFYRGKEDHGGRRRRFRHGRSELPDAASAEK